MPWRMHAFGSLASLGALVPVCPWFLGALVRWLFGTLALRYLGPLASWARANLVPKPSGSLAHLVIWFVGPLALRPLGSAQSDIDIGTKTR